MLASFIFEPYNATPGMDLLETSKFRSYSCFPGSFITSSYINRAHICTFNSKLKRYLHLSEKKTWLQSHLDIELKQINCSENKHMNNEIEANLYIVNTSNNLFASGPVITNLFSHIRL